MPYDPTLPLPNSPLESQVIRDQLQSLFVLINNIVSVTAAQVDSTITLPPGSSTNASVGVIGNTLHFIFEIPEGPEGQMGAQGPPFSQAVVDSVNTVDPSTPAAVVVSFDGSNVRFTFDIPRGNDGSQGTPGTNGNDGAQGPQGTQGPPFAQAVIDGVSTLDPGQLATVNVNFDGANVRFQFGIPRGADGAAGAPGEVTNADLSNAISNAVSGTSNNSNAVSTLDTPFADPDAESMRQRFNDLLTALRR